MDNIQPSADRGEGTEPWEYPEGYVKQERGIQPIRRLVLKGPIDVLVRRHSDPLLIVAGRTDKAVSQVLTTFRRDKLIIEDTHPGIVIHSSTWSGTMHIHRHRPGRPRVIVGLGLPSFPEVKLKGSGNVTLLDVHQSDLMLKLTGSGRIEVSGTVQTVSIDLTGAGSIRAGELIADQADLSISGAGNIEAFARAELVARISGVGNMLVSGDPPRRSQFVSGFGKVKFKT